MAQVETIRIKRLGGFIIINKSDFDPARHVLYEEPISRKGSTPPPPPSVPAAPEKKDADLPEVPGVQESGDQEAGAGQGDASGKGSTEQPPIAQAVPKEKGPAKKKAASKKKR
jgi:hypothetical protein